MNETAETRLERDIAGVVALLGGGAAMRKGLSTPIKAHDVIQRGFPSGALVHLVDSIPALGREDSLPKVLGISLRTLQRFRKAGGSEPLNREQSGRLYRTAEIVAKAIDVFGSSKDAERFFEEPALALDGQRPFDLLSTPVGSKMVEKHLVRLDLGVYT